MATTSSFLPTADPRQAFDTDRLLAESRAAAKAAEKSTIQKANDAATASINAPDLELLGLMMPTLPGTINVFGLGNELGRIRANKLQAIKELDPRFDGDVVADAIAANPAGAPAQLGRLLSEDEFTIFEKMMAGELTPTEVSQISPDLDRRIVAMLDGDVEPFRQQLRSGLIGHLNTVLPFSFTEEVLQATNQAISGATTILPATLSMLSAVWNGAIENENGLKIDLDGI